MAKKAERKEAQERLAAERARQASAQRRRNVLYAVVAGVVVIAIVVAAGIGINNANKNSGSGSGGTPAAATSDNGGIPIGVTAEVAASQKLPTIDVYEDYQCPVCAEFESLDSATLENLAKDNKARVVYHAINIIGPKFSGQAGSSSLRGGSAAGCASDESIDDFIAFHNTAFKNQPSEGTGMSNAELIQWGKDSGITSDKFAKCVNDETYVGWVKRVDTQASDRGVTGTPTLYVDGTELKPADWQTPAALTAAIAKNTKK